MYLLFGKRGWFFFLNENWRSVFDRSETDAEKVSQLGSTSIFVTEMIQHEEAKAVRTGTSDLYPPPNPFAFRGLPNTVFILHFVGRGERQPVLSEGKAEGMEKGSRELNRAGRRRGEGTSTRRGLTMNPPCSPRDAPWDEVSKSFPHQMSGEQV